MDRIIITGKANLFGSINVKGSKNAALPILVSSLLSKEDLKLYNIPEFEDILYSVMVKEHNSNGAIFSKGDL